MLLAGLAQGLALSVNHSASVAVIAVAVAMAVWNLAGGTRRAQAGASGDRSDTGMDGALGLLSLSFQRKSSGAR